MEKLLVVQCSLWDEENHEYVAFIPKNIAARGNVILLPDKPGRWHVREVYVHSTREYAEASERSRDHLRQREFSDA